MMQDELSLRENDAYARYAIDNHDESILNVIRGINPILFKEVFYGFCRKYGLSGSRIY